jgi:hypothetical protein
MAAKPPSALDTTATAPAERVQDFPIKTKKRKHGTRNHTVSQSSQLFTANNATRQASV